MQLAHMAGLIKASFLGTSPLGKAGKTPKPRYSSRWLVVANCQTVGLANCLSLLRPDAQIEACNLWELKKNLRRWKARLPQYDRIIAAPEVESFGLPHLIGQSHVTCLPGVVFSGYHPDLCYITHGRKFLKGPVDDYHSLIAITAFKLGLSPAQTEPLFRQDVFHRLGYFDVWNPQREQLLDTFKNAGLDIRDEFLRWVRRGPFMYSINHPRIEVLYGLARMVAGQGSGACRDGGTLPHDNLANSPVFPVYPEIAEQLGLPDGSLLFKPLGEYRLLSLHEFIERCFSVYAQHEKDSLELPEPLFERAAHVIAEAR